MLAEITLATLRRAERALGPSAAITVAQAAVDAAEGPLKRTLLLAALGLAIRAEDAGAFARFAGEWASAGGSASERRGLSLVARLASVGPLASAQRLARAELERHRSPEAALALAALLAREGRIDEALWREAGAIGARAALAYAPPERADEAEAALGASRDMREVLRLAPVALTSPRLYTRVRVLDRLLDLGTMPALRIALAHVDLRGAALSPIERDRIVAIAKRVRAPQPVLDALEGRGASPVDEAEARDALVGHAPARESADRAVTLSLRALAAIARDESAELLLSALAAHPPTSVAWTAAIAGLAKARSREAALGCATRWIEAGVAPPRGFATLASALARAGSPALAERALGQAIRASEPGARERLAQILEHRAREAYAAGDLAAAKALLERSLAIVPD